MRKGMHWAAQGAAVVVPVALGIPLAVDGTATIYTGYASMWWPSTKAVVTRFRAVPVHPQDDAHEEEKRPDLDREGEEDTRAMTGWQKARQHVDRLLNGKHTLDFTVEFEYTLPDGSVVAALSHDWTSPHGLATSHQKDVRRHVEEGCQLPQSARSGVSVVHDAG
jgi:hypothetical protein